LRCFNSKGAQLRGAACFHFSIGYTFFAVLLPENLPRSPQLVDLIATNTAAPPALSALPAQKVQRDVLLLIEIG